MNVPAAAVSNGEINIWYLFTYPSAYPSDNQYFAKVNLMDSYRAQIWKDIVPAKCTANNK